MCVQTTKPSTLSPFHPPAFPTESVNCQTCWTVFSVVSALMYPHSSANVSTTEWMEGLGACIEAVLGVGEDMFYLGNGSPIILRKPVCKAREGSANSSSDVDGVGGNVPNCEHGLNVKMRRTRWERRKNEAKWELGLGGCGDP